MSSAVVWVSHQDAKIFRFQGEQAPQPEKVAAHHHPQGAKQDLEKFYHELAGKLTGLSEILLVGSGTAKEEFRHHLENHHHSKVAASIVGVESADHLTDPQLLALARKFFKSHHLFS